MDHLVSRQSIVYNLLKVKGWRWLPQQQIKTILLMELVTRALIFFIADYQPIYGKPFFVVVYIQIYYKHLFIGHLVVYLFKILVDLIFLGSFDL